MAASSIPTEKLSTLLQCPVCVETLTRPKAFPCLHCYCSTCIDSLRTVTKGSQVGYNCPICREFTPKHQIRNVHFMHDILEMLSKAQTERETCANCKKSESVWYCNECKEPMCESCRERHDGFSLFKNHTGQSLADGSPKVVDRHVFCKEHPEKIAEVYCCKCKTLVCLLCSATKHKIHKTQSIDEVLEEMLPSVKENQGKVQTFIKNTTDVLESTRAYKDTLQKRYQDNYENIDRQYELIVKKAKEERDKAKELLADNEIKQMTDIDENIQNIKRELTNKQNVLNVVDKTLSMTQGTSLLQALQSGLKEGLDDICSKNQELQPYTKPEYACFLPVETEHLQLLGKIAPPMPSRLMPKSLAGVTKLNGKLENQFQTSFWSFSFALIENKLWFPNRDTNKIHISTLKGEEVKTIQLDNAGECRSVVLCHDSVLIATTNGIFTVNSQGEHQQKLADGDFCDLSILGNTLYALDNAQGKVQVFFYMKENKKHVKERDIKLSNYIQFDANTIQVTMNDIYIGLFNSHIIQQYSHSGTLTATHGQGQLRGPRLCGADSHGHVLVADVWHNSLKSLSPEGLLTNVEVQGLGDCPWHAIITDDKLLVRHGGPPNHFQTFSLK